MKSKTLAKIARRIGYAETERNINIEKRVANLIVAPPADVAEITEIHQLFGRDYDPGTFRLSERRNRPSFLFDETVSNYREWVFDKVECELKLLSRIPEARKSIDNYGNQAIKRDLYSVLHFKLSKEYELHDVICNQEYSDSFRRIIALLLTGSVSKLYDTHAELNQLGYQIAIPILQKTQDYDLYDRLRQSISSGLIGMDIKDEVAATSPLSRKGIIPLKKKRAIEDKIDFVKEELDKRIKHGLAIDFWQEFTIEVLSCERDINLAWFTDDYIPTIFEMKFIEEALRRNHRMRVFIIPRRFRCGNDASYADVNKLVGEPIFQELQQLRNRNRFCICSSGPDTGTFNGFRISREVARILFLSDVVVITGARSYEMGQGIRKLTYFSGIAICRRYTECVTGIDMDSGSSIFVRQDPGIPSFCDFRARAWRRATLENGKSIAVAGMTTTEYATAVRSNNYANILRRFNNDRNRANMWIVTKAKQQGITFAEVVKSLGPTVSRALR